MLLLQLSFLSAFLAASALSLLGWLGVLNDCEVIGFTIMNVRVSAELLLYLLPDFLILENS